MPLIRRKSNRDCKVFFSTVRKGVNSSLPVNMNTIIYKLALFILIAFFLELLNDLIFRSIFIIFFFFASCKYIKGKKGEAMKDNVVRLQSDVS